MTAQPLLQFGTVALDPAPDCRVVRFQAALAEQLFDIAERERIPKAPAHGAQNQLGLGLSPLKDRRSDACLMISSGYQPPSAKVVTQPIAALCRREGLAPNLYHRWSKEFLEAGKKRLLGDTMREATSTEVQDLRRENSRLKLVVAELVLENRPGSWENSGGGGNLFRSAV